MSASSKGNKAHSLCGSGIYPPSLNIGGRYWPIKRAETASVISECRGNKPMWEVKHSITICDEPNM